MKKNIPFYAILMIFGFISEILHLKEYSTASNIQPIKISIYKGKNYSCSASIIHYKAALVANKNLLFFNGGKVGGKSVFSSNVISLLENKYTIKYIKSYNILLFVVQILGISFIV